MTRDEARFKLLEATESRCTESFITDLLDSLVALGMLKLDEPKSETGAERALIEKCKSEGFAYEAGKNLVGLISRAGLKLDFK